MLHLNLWEWQSFLLLICHWNMIAGMRLKIFINKEANSLPQDLIWENNASSNKSLKVYESILKTAWYISLCWMISLFSHMKFVGNRNLNDLYLPFFLMNLCLISLLIESEFCGDQNLGIQRVSFQQFICSFCLYFIHDRLGWNQALGDLRTSNCQEHWVLTPNVWKWSCCRSLKMWSWTLIYRSHRVMSISNSTSATSL